MKKLFLSTLTLLLVAGTHVAQTPVRVKTADGILEGVNESGVKVFKGVPFAAPPGGRSALACTATGEALGGRA